MNDDWQAVGSQGSRKLLDNGRVIYRTPGDVYSIADQTGWLPGIYASEEAAIAAFDSDASGELNQLRQLRAELYCVVRTLEEAAREAENPPRPNGLQSYEWHELTGEARAYHDAISQIYGVLGEIPRPGPA